MGTLSKNNEVIKHPCRTYGLEIASPWKLVIHKRKGGQGERFLRMCTWIMANSIREEPSFLKVKKPHNYSYLRSPRAKVFPVIR